jgi:hypothetical protein
VGSAIPKLGAVRSAYFFALLHCDERKTLMMAITGAGLIVGASLAFWQFLPRKGREHPFVRNSGVGSMITIVLLSALTFGVAMLWAGLSG